VPHAPIQTRFAGAGQCVAAHRWLPQMVALRTAGDRVRVLITSSVGSMHWLLLR
jgi:hypothetical protein